MTIDLRTRPRGMRPPAPSSRSRADGRGDPRPMARAGAGSRSHGTSGAAPSSRRRPSTGSRPATPAKAPRRGPNTGRARTRPGDGRPPRGARPLQRRQRKAQPPRTVALHFTAGNPRRRLVALFVVSLVLFVAVIGRVAYLQTFGSESLLAAGRAQRVTESVLHAQRGTIFARDGGELALSVPSSTIIANPKLVTDPTGAAATLASLLGLSAEKQRSLVEAFTLKEKSFVYVARQVDEQLAETVMALRLAGVDVLSEDRRIMPSGEVGRSLLGRTDIDGIGIAGLELLYDELLTGSDGERVREHDRNGRSIPGSGTTTVEPVPGVDLVLSLDRSLQFQVENALLARVTELQAKGGTVIVMSTATGEIYAVANVTRDTESNEVAVTSANLAAVDAFEPGSVAKVFSLAAAVDAGLAGPDTTISVPGTWTFNEGTQWELKIKDAEPHDEMPMTLRDIIVDSSNIGTLLMSSGLSEDQFHEYMSGFGFGQPTGLGFPDETNGWLADVSEWNASDQAAMSYGYAYGASAFQLAAAVNTVANGGEYVAPKLLLATIGSDGEVVETEPSVTRTVLSPETAATMTDMMEDVVCLGTGRDARLDGISAAGKTGTAYKNSNGSYGEDGNRAYRASFVGFFPAQAPQVTILVTIDEPDPTSNDRFGGKAAAPLFATVATAAIHELAIAPTPGDTGCAAG